MPRPDPAVWSVSRVNHAVRNLIESQTRPLWVMGELSSWMRSRNDHRYFTLKDERAELRCVLFASDAWRLPSEPVQGSHLRAFGQLTIYPARGTYQLRATKIATAEGEGLWRLAFDRLRNALDAEGLLDPERKRPLPELPSTIAVVTSPSGAAVRDVIATVHRRAPWVRLVVSPTGVQGEGAAEEIARAVRRAARVVSPDLIIVCRGGGGAEDLWAFNQEATARAIAESPVPVLTGIGHEVDRTIADLVADRAAATPSAAAELAVPEVGAIQSQLKAMRVALDGALRGAVLNRRRRLTDAVVALERAGGTLLDPLRQTTARAGRNMEAAVREVVAARRAHLTTRVAPSMEAAVRAVLSTRRGHLTNSAGRLDDLSPLATLARGYSVALSEDGEVLARKSDLWPGRDFSLRVTDGHRPCTVREA